MQASREFIDRGTESAPTVIPNDNQLVQLVGGEPVSIRTKDGTQFEGQITKYDYEFIRLEGVQANGPLAWALIDRSEVAFIHPVRAKQE